MVGIRLQRLGFWFPRVPKLSNIMRHEQICIKFGGTDLHDTIIIASAKQVREEALDAVDGCTCKSYIYKPLTGLPFRMNSLVSTLAYLHKFARVCVQSSVTSVSLSTVGRPTGSVRTHDILFPFPTAHILSPDPSIASPRHDRFEGRAENFSS